MKNLQFSEKIGDFTIGMHGYVSSFGLNRNLSKNAGYNENLHIYQQLPYQRVRIRVRSLQFALLAAR